MMTDDMAVDAHSMQCGAVQSNAVQRNKVGSTTNTQSMSRSICFVNIEASL